MKDYFLVYQMGLTRGSNMLLYIVYLVMMILLLDDLPKDWKGWMQKAAELVICWCGMQVISAVYYACFGENYLNQVHEILFAVLYALFRSPYRASKRVVMCCAGWSSQTLLIGISGAIGLGPWSAGIAVMALEMLLLVLFFRKFAVEEFSLAPWHYSAVVLALALCGIISSANWKGEPESDAYALVTDVVLLGTLLLVYYMFYYTNLTYQRNLELAAVQQRQKANEDVLSLARKNREEMRILRHELKNHDAYIRTLLSQKRYDELEQYVQRDMTNIAHITHQVDSGNETIDTILNQKIAVGEASGIRLECQLAVPEVLPFSEIEFCSMLANLLDNALEACAACPEEKRVIQLKMYQNRGYLLLHMENPFVDTISRAERLKLVTAKGDSTAHGYGTKVIQRVAERYNGYVQYSIEGDLFFSDVMLAMDGSGGQDETH